MSDETDQPVNRGGRPTVYREAYVEQARKLCERGFTDAEIADFWDVCRMTLYRWRCEYPEFAAAFKLGKEVADDRVERSAYERACGYEYDTEKVFQYEGGIIRAACKTHVPADTTAFIFWLKNRRPDKWRDRSQHEVSGPGGGPIETREMGTTDLARRISHIIEQAANKTDDGPGSDAVPRAEPDPAGDADQ